MDRCKKAKLLCRYFSSSLQAELHGEVQRAHFFPKNSCALPPCKRQIHIKVKMGMALAFFSPISINFQFGFAVSCVEEIRKMAAVVIFPVRHLSLCYKVMV